MASSELHRTGPDPHRTGSDPYRSGAGTAVHDESRTTADTRSSFKSHDEQGHVAPKQGHFASKSKDASPGRLIAGMANDVSVLLRQEIALARTELSEKVDQVRTGFVELSSGALVTYAGVLFLLLSATAALALVMPLWGAALVVGGITTIVGALLLGSGRSHLKSGNLVPERTMHSLRTDAQFAKDEVRRAR